MEENSKNYRNFAILAHIDHGKSTLADRLLEMTGTVEKRKMKEQLLDQMDLERERGITIKLQPVRMNYFFNNEEYILNLIDTPGHVDFNYEVSRSLAAVEGAVLLVDATKGVQAQTLSNLYLAIEQGIEIIPAVNKIDLPNADIEKTKKEIMHILGCKKEEILEVSGKTGEGVKKLLESIIKIVPSPKGNFTQKTRALIFDSKYDSYKGVLAYVRIVDGCVKGEDKIFMMASEKESEAIEVGYFKPDLQKTQILVAGDIGYIATGLKSVKHCRVGDTITVINKKEILSKKASNLKFKDQNLTKPLPGYKQAIPMVYASFYPINSKDYNFMREALEKLKLNDSAFVFEPESNLALGRGFRCGFLGMLHLEIIQSRLEREFNLSPTVTIPSVVYEVQLRRKKEIKSVEILSEEIDNKNKTGKIKIYSASEFPDPSSIEKIYEPYVKLDIISPSQYLGAIMDVMRNTRAEYKNTEYINAERIILSFDCPLADIITNLHDNIKSVSSGYASINYETIGYRPYNLVKMDILVAGEIVPAFARIVPKEWAFKEGKRIVEKLKESIPRQNFVITLQAAVGGKIIARENISAFRKDVTAKLYGGDVTRKKKLLEKQKKGKKKMKKIGRISIPPETFLAVLKK